MGAAAGVGGGEEPGDHRLEDAGVEGGGGVVVEVQRVSLGLLPGSVLFVVFLSGAAAELAGRADADFANAGELLGAALLFDCESERGNGFAVGGFDEAAFGLPFFVVDRYLVAGEDAVELGEGIVVGEGFGHGTRGEGSKCICRCFRGCRCAQPRLMAVNPSGSMASGGSAREYSLDPPYVSFAERKTTLGGAIGDDGLTGGSHLVVCGSDFIHFQIARQWPLSNTCFLRFGACRRGASITSRCARCG